MLGPPVSKLHQDFPVRSKVHLDIFQVLIVVLHQGSPIHAVFPEKIGVLVQLDVVENSDHLIYSDLIQRSIEFCFFDFNILL